MTSHLPAALASLAAAVLALVVAVPPAHAAGKGPEVRALERALKLLPQPPSVPIRFIDPELAADPDAIRRIDAFLVRDANGKVRQVIYLNRRSSIVENAIVGRDIDIAILAAVIRHEQEHLRGGTEKDARLVEREFFQSLVFAGHVPTDEGLAYLRDLEQHHQLREG
jgi:hypothetical protein